MDITVLGTEMLVKTKYSNLFLIHVLTRFLIELITQRFSPFIKVFSLGKKQSSVVGDGDERKRRDGEKNATQQAQLKITQSRRL